MEALRVNAQENVQRVAAEDPNMCQDLTSADRDYPLNVSHLCENMTPDLANSPSLNTTGRSVGVSLKDDDHDEDFVKPKSCWSFCLFRKNKSKSKKDSVKQKPADKMDKLSASNVNLSVSQNASEKKSQRMKLKEKPINEKSIFSHSDILDRLYTENNNLLHQTSANKDFEHKAAELYAKIADELTTEIIRYFEQELGVLVLEVAARDASVDVVCICMAHPHVRSLQQAVSGGRLLTKIEGMLGKVDTAMFGSQEVKVKIDMDDNEMCTVVGELS